MKPSKQEIHFRILGVLRITHRNQKLKNSHCFHRMELFQEKVDYLGETELWIVRSRHFIPELN